MMPLSRSELIVANEYCKGLEDKEVANSLHKSIWTIKTQKRTIYRKLGISKETELMLYMLCDRLEKNFDLKEIRKHGFEFFFSALFFIIQIIGDYHIDMRRCRLRSNCKTSVRVTKLSRRNNEFNFNNYELFI